MKLPLTKLKIIYILCLSSTCSYFRIPQLFAEDYIPFKTPRLKIIPPKTPIKKQTKKKRKRSRQKSVKIQPQKNPPEKIRSFRAITKLSLILPTILTSGPRQKYTTDLTTHLSFISRYDKKNPQTNWQLWLGLRLATFTGTGIFNETAGRWGFLYFGPIVGFGKIVSNIKKFNHFAMTSSERQSQSHLEKQYAWLILTGMSLQNRIAQTDPTTDAASDDLSTEKKATFDAPGLWLTASYSHIFKQSMGISYESGFQLGNGKTFVWIGISFASFL